MGLDTLVYHVCEKSGDIHIPDISAVYEQILATNQGKYPNVLLLPELNGHAVWADELAWVASNFGGVSGIPIMLDVAGGWEHHVTTEEIAAAMAVANVRWLRIAELVSWYIEHPAVPFPTAYVTGILNFCRANGLKLFWCEWKVDWNGDDTFKAIQTYIAGFEDIVTVAFKTNSGDLEPAAGFAYVKNLFLHAGATVESWYWETRHRTDVWEPAAGLENPDNMPVSWMVRHAAEAKTAGVEVIQFEPYWYFFDKTTGTAKDALKTLHAFLNSQMMNMEASTVILQTLQAEWVNGPAKAEISWLAGRASTVVGWDIQPSTFDFNNLPKKYAVSCYSRGSSSPSGSAWLKVEVVTVEILVKVLGNTLEKASLARQSMQVEVERIIHAYSAVGLLWDLNPGPTGVYKHRRIPGLKDVVISSEGNPAEDSKVTRVAFQVRCKFLPNKMGA